MFSQAYVKNSIQGGGVSEHTFGQTPPGQTPPTPELWDMVKKLVVRILLVAFLFGRSFLFVHRDLDKSDHEALL